MGGQSGSWTPTKRRGPIAAEFQGPGPAALTLPSLFGNPSIKESSKSRAPAFTFGSRHEKKVAAAAPAPNAYNTSGLNPRGKDDPKAPTMHIKPKDPKQFVTPSPGAYNPDLADKDIKQSAPKYSFGIKPKNGKPAAGPAPNAYSLQKVDKSPSHAFGIKHSPYIGTLKGDAWVGAKTELSSPVAVRGTAGGSSSETRTVTMNGTTGGSKTTVTTRTHSDGHKIRTETITYTKGPTTTSRVTTSKRYTNEQATLA